MSCFSKVLHESAEYKTISGAIHENRLPAGVTGVSLIHKAHLVHSLCEDETRRAVIIVADEAEGSRLVENLNAMKGGALLYPARDFNLRPAQSQSREYEQQRLGVLGHMLEGEYRVVVCSVEAAMQLTLPPEELYTRTVTLKAGEDRTPDSVVEALLAAGYVRAETVDGTGQFARRGGIIDFFPPDGALPLRVEFWGDSIDTVAHFEIESQRRTDQLQVAKITPALEILFDSPELLADKIETHCASLRGKAVKAKASLLADADSLRAGAHLSSLDRYLNLAYEAPATILNYAEDALLFISDSGKVKERASAAASLLNEELKELFEDGILCRGLDTFTLGWGELVKAYEDHGAIYLDTFARGSFDTPVKALTNLNAQQLPVWGGSLDILLQELRPAREQGDTCVVMAGTDKAAKTLAQDLEAEGLPSVFFNIPPSEFPSSRISILPGGLTAGIEYPLLKFMLFTHGRAAGSSRRTVKKNKNPRAGIHSLDELHRGDYIVHAVHGIGIFDGINKLEVSGVTKDYIKIKYAKEDVLYVPVTQLDLVSKYIGPHEDGKNLKINRLGGKEWQKTRSRVRAAVKDMAEQLTRLYAERMKAPGYAFSPDSDMQNDFERRFEFEETDDQLRCIDEIKGDMEKNYPMDRLLCGDVGFGKTEVALRAAFKCIAEGKQCAMLVPTTILAFQHYQTILKRFEGFPVEVEMISRFRTPQEQSKILRGLRQGSVDMVVGTHRLISKDIKFKALGLVIIDEEQRFGVAQKEHLKELFPTVDVLTLSATPIPRTLNMAMTGIRDMSMLEEAPQDRHPVQTYVLEHDMGILAEAMQKELRRGGQVYYLHNRVDTITRAAARIREFLPDARIGIAHGKMEEEELSEIWSNLLNGEIDILVCTTIIETGVDVPNVNTLIIENADRLGLAQLHQIRGRVGRSARRAYAYLTFTRGKELSEIATRRLSAIREYTEFGSGFQIAMRDLEIRGAGNILGAQQHGHMEAVGYDMYIQMLSEAIAEERGEKPEKPEEECLIDLQIEAHIPEEYIESIPQRLAIYRRIADIRTPDDVEDVYDELIDRFGDPPPSVQGLVNVSLLRNSASAQGIYEISQRGNCLLLYANAIDMQKVSRLAALLRGRILVSAGAKPYISVKMDAGQSPVDALQEALRIYSAEPGNKKTDC